MRSRSKTRDRGFTLMEMLVAMALGLMVLGAAVQLYTQAVNATWSISQRAEMQQDFRAAADMLTRDLSLAGSGLGNNVQIALPAGTGTRPVYGCSQTACYLNGTGAAYPTQGSQPYLYGLMPGWKFGPILNSAPGPTDTATVVYTDNSFYLNCYLVKITSATTVRFTVPTTLPANCVLPRNLAAPQAVNDPVVGLTPGDVVWFSVTNGVGAGATYSPVIAEVTGVGSLSGTVPNQYFDVEFAAGDALQMNQPTAASGALVNVPNWTGSATRLLVITYYIDNTINTPRLMRQVSGHTPMPVAENVVFLQFSYDLYDSATGAVITNQADGGASQSLTPNQITKINILHMAMNSTLPGVKGYQGLDLQTSVSARDLTFRNNYPQ
ncbi:MAG TPA: prepilin-type N-terminal cleavage/methylation domain-containing protein [Terriglobales bacterium]